MSKKRNSKLGEMELTSPTYLLIEAKSLHEAETLPTRVSFPSVMSFLPPASNFRFTLFRHFFATLSSLYRLQHSRARPGVLTSYYSGIPSRARLRTRFASIMRNVYPANGVEASRFLVGKGWGRALGARRRKKRLSSYWRRIELRFLSNSEDRTNLKSAGSRRWILTTTCRHFAFMEMIGHGYSGISNLLIVYIVRLEFP